MLMPALHSSPLPVFPPMQESPWPVEKSDKTNDKNKEQLVLKVEQGIHTGRIFQQTNSN